MGVTGEPRDEQAGASSCCWITDVISSAQFRLLDVYIRQTGTLPAFLSGR